MNVYDDDFKKHLALVCIMELISSDSVCRY